MPHAVRFAVVLAVFATACTPKVRIERTLPARLPIAEGKKLAVQVDPDGSGPPASTIVGVALDVAQGQLLNKWVAVEPVRVELDRQLRRTAFSVVDKAAADYLIRARPTDWVFRIENRQQGRVGVGKLHVRIEVVPAKDPNAPPVFTDTYWASTETSSGEPDAMTTAAQSLAARFIEDLMPTRVSTRVELDDSDPLVKPGIELCNAGKLDAAHAAFSDMVARSPSSAPALYNLAVLTEARGEYDQAESLLLKATQISPKPLYYEALERVRASRRDAQTLKKTL